ncbi:MAG: LacI family DNA-binding transcriptional regulator [Capsulimonadaceae bacterium]|nr:LacI family DNA-binding transcriptional regulator [Capsulimonadaceae bacterium]
MRKTSTRDIANLAGVSQATVSYVLNGRQDQSISDQTRRRVLDAATRLRYRPNRLASGFFGGRSSMIGVVFPCVDSSFFGRLLFGIQEVCLEYDSVSILSFTQTDPQQEQRAVDQMLEHRVDGLLMVSGVYTGMWFDDVRTESIPCVLLDDRTHAATYDVVASDDVAGAKNAVEYLIGLGHRRIGMLGYNSPLTPVRDRRIGYEAALREAGLEVEPGIYLECEWDETPEGYGTLLFDLIDRYAPTAFFAATDYHAHDFIKAVHQRGLRVPEDFSVIGYSDTELGTGLNLSTVRQDAVAMGSTAATRLFERIASQDRERCEILMPTELVVRGSCCSPQAKGVLAGVGGKQ